MGRFITITEIAKRLDISHSTVSRALDNNPRISEQTRQKVKALADQLGYHANATANQLSKGQSKLIGVIVPDLSIFFFAKVLESIQQKLESEGYAVLLFNTAESIDKEQQAIDTCLKYRVDGVIAAISMQSKTFDHFEKLLKCEVPLVFFDRVANFLPVPKVIANDHQAAYRATQYLIKSGCQCVAHITGSINLNNSNNRLYGYLDALRDQGRLVDEALIHYYQFKPDSIDRFLQKILKSHPQLDGLFVFNDYVANYTVNVLQKMGKKVPDDISVFGFSDEPIATNMSPKLSTVQQIAPEMGLLSAQKMIAILQNKEPISNEKIVIDPQLVIRESTRGIGG